MVWFIAFYSSCSTLRPFLNNMSLEISHVIMLSSLFFRNKQTKRHEKQKFKLYIWLRTSVPLIIRYLKRAATAVGKMLKGAFMTLNSWIKLTEESSYSEEQTNNFYFVKQAWVSQAEGFIFPSSQWSKREGKNKCTGNVAWQELLHVAL